MRHTILAAATAAGLLLGVGGSANAMSDSTFGDSTATMTATPLVAGADDVASLTLVREGCGFGGHRNFYGGCRGNRGWRGDVYRSRRGYYRGGYGYHRGYRY